MAPGCSITNNQPHQLINSIQLDSDTNFSTSTSSSLSSSFSSSSSAKHNQIPLPSTPPPPQVLTTQNTTSAPVSNKVIRRSQSFRTLETVDSFEILEQTIMKQKRLSKTKNTDLRMKILLKRTFNLVCEMMDQEKDCESTKNEQTYDLDIQEKDSDLQETLIINLNESETLDSTFQTDEADEQLNYIDLENFNYENLLENQQPILDDEKHGLDKNQSFLSEDFFSVIDDSNEPEEYTRFKRRRSSADDDIDFDEEYEVTSSDTEELSYYLFSDLTNSKSSKKRCINSVDESLSNTGNNNKRFKESINIVT